MFTPPGVLHWTRYQNNGSIELHHIERCMDPGWQRSSQEDYHLFHIINELTKENDIGSIINIRNNDRESSMNENIKRRIYLSEERSINISFVRVIRTHSQIKSSDQLLNDDICPSIIENSIQLDNPSELSHRMNSNYRKTLVTHVPSSENHSSQSIYNKRHLHRKLMKKIPRLAKVTKKEKTNDIRMILNVIVKRLRRKTSLLDKN